MLEEGSITFSLIENNGKYLFKLTRTAGVFSTRYFLTKTTGQIHFSCTHSNSKIEIAFNNLSINERKIN